MPRTLTLAIVLAVGALFGAACSTPSESSAGAEAPQESAGASDGADDTETPADEPAGELADPCALMTDAEVASVTGETPVSSRSATVTEQYRTCLWSDGSSDMFILTVQSDHDWDLLLQVAQARGADDYRDLPGVGDRAFVALDSTVTAEADGVAVTAEGRVDRIDALEALMPTVMTRLG